MRGKTKLPEWMYGEQFKRKENDYVPPPTPKDPLLLVPVRVDPHQYPFTWKPHQLDRYFAQVKQSEGFDVDPVIGGQMYCSIVPMDHLGVDKKQCERMAMFAIIEYNRRYKDKGELVFGKVIKVMGKAVNGIIYYLTVEAVNLSTGIPVTFQAVTFIGVHVTEVQSFRFISDSKKEPWLWVGHLCSSSSSTLQGQGITRAPISVKLVFR